MCNVVNWLNRSGRFILFYSKLLPNLEVCIDGSRSISIGRFVRQSANPNAEVSSLTSFKWMRLMRCIEEMSKILRLLKIYAKIFIGFCMTTADAIGIIIVAPLKLTD